MISRLSIAPETVARVELKEDVIGRRGPDDDAVYEVVVHTNRGDWLVVAKTDAYPDALRTYDAIREAMAA